MSCQEALPVRQFYWVLKDEFVEVFNFPLWRYVLWNSSWQRENNDSWCPELPELGKTEASNFVAMRKKLY